MNATRLRLAAVAVLIATNSFAAPAAPLSISQFLKIRTPSAPYMLPDGALLLRDSPDGVSQLYRIAPVTAAGGEPSYRPGVATVTRLTNYEDGLSNYSVSPDGHTVILMNAAGGNENTQLTLMDLNAPAGTALVPVLANPTVQAAVNAWSRDGSGFFYSANRESPNDFYLYRYDIATRKHTRVLAQSGSWEVRGVTRDGARALVEHAISASDVRCFELDVATSRLRDITLVPRGGTAACEVVDYLPDERSVLLRSDYRDGVTRLYVRDLATNAVRQPIAALGRYDLEVAGLNDDRTFLFTATNEDGFRVMHVYTVPGFRPLVVPAAERGLVSPAGFRGFTMTWTRTDTRTPSAAFATVYPQAAARGGIAATALVTRQLTWPDDQGIELAKFPLPTLVHYPAFDRREIPAFLFLPAGYTAGQRIPFIVMYHGGPEGQSRPQFSATTAYFVARGYGVMLPNVRGSTGYGRAFQMLDDYRLRWNSVRDGVDAAEWLVKSGYAEPGRIATYGGSYGGFMSVACVVEDQDRVDRGARHARLFGACVDVVGIVNLRTFLAGTSGYRRKLREVEYGPMADSTFLDSVSSIRRVDKIQVPLFIGHGFNDPRVPVGEAMQLALALQQRGRSPRLFIAPDEGHGFAKLDNRIYFYDRMATFLDETIGNRQPEPQPPGDASPN